MTWKVFWAAGEIVGDTAAADNGWASAGAGGRVGIRLIGLGLAGAAWADPVAAIAPAAARTVAAASARIRTGARFLMRALSGITFPFRRTCFRQ